MLVPRSVKQKRKIRRADMEVIFNAVVMVKDINTALEVNKEFFGKRDFPCGANIRFFVKNNDEEYGLLSVGTRLGTGKWDELKDYPVSLPDFVNFYEHYMRSSSVEMVNILNESQSRTWGFDVEEPDLPYGPDETKAGD